MAKLWQALLRDNYVNFEEFANYDGIYGLANRLGYPNPETAWDDNPLIQGSVDPKDFGRGDARAYYAKRMRRWTDNTLTRTDEALATVTQFNSSQRAMRLALDDEFDRRIRYTNRLHAIADSV